jgi:hypothetical protein
VSNHLAIAAVTETLRNVLTRAFENDPDVPGVTVTTVPPVEAAPGTSDGHRLNLFLYAVSVNQGWRNEPLPSAVRPGETGFPPLPLNLSYLLTPYENGDGHLGHIILGKGMRALHDTPVLDPREVHDAIEGGDLHTQVERVRVVPAQLSLDDMSKLWTTFQSAYRLSAVYQASVVLIESLRQPKTPLPVLARGEGDRGPSAVPGLDPPFPRLDAIEMPGRLQSAARPGDTITVRGAHLDATPLRIELRHPLVPDPHTIEPLPGGGADRVRATLPLDLDDWPAGFSALSVVLGESEKKRTTNALPLAIAPRFTLASKEVARDGTGAATFVVTPSPPVHTTQQVGFLVGDRQVVRDRPTDPIEEDGFLTTVTFILRDAVAGRYFTRLRVDGVDSILVTPGVEPPAFDPATEVEIT